MNKEVCPEKIVTRKKVLINSSIFCGLILLTFYILFRNNNIEDIINAISSVNKNYILVGVLCMCLFISCEAINIGRSLKLFGYKVGFFTTLKYALVGFFFSSVTPSASGGQPMQVYYMHKDKINICHGALALLMDLASYQFVTVSMAIIGLIYHYGLFSESLGQIRYLLLGGVLLNTTALILILIAIFSKNLIMKFIDLITSILKKFNYKKADYIKEKALSVAQEYGNSAVYFKDNKFTVVKILITTTIQIAAVHSIPFWIYKSFGISGYSLGSVIALQAVLFITVSALPLPGAVGVSESGFMIMYKTLFPAQILSSAMILSRGISFYLFVLLSGVIIAMTYLFKMKSKVNNVKNKNNKIYGEIAAEKAEVKNIELQHTSSRR